MNLARTADLQLKTDNEHLNLLRIFHFVLAGLSALSSCLFMIHIFVGFSMLSQTPMGFLMIAIGVAGLLIGWSYSAFLVYAGMCLARREKRTTLLVASGLNCCNFPLGLVLGVFSFIVLLRPSVKELFAENENSRLLNKSNVEEPATILNLPDPDEEIWKEIEAKAKLMQKEESQ